jgi:hypothetical protein
LTFWPCGMNSKWAIPLKGKGKLNLSLCLTKHHAMETYWRSGGVVPRILWLRQ